MEGRKVLNLLLLASMLASLLVGSSVSLAQEQKPPADKSAAPPAIEQIAPLLAPQPPDAAGNGIGNGQGTAKDRCKNKMRCINQDDRKAARLNAPPQKTGVTNNFAGINPATAAYSPLAPVDAGKGAQAAGVGAVAASMGTAFDPNPDYFAVPNWANSPLPTVGPGPIMGVTVLNGGGGYTNSSIVNLSDPTGTGATFAVTAVAGVIQSIQVTAGGANYSKPVIVSITDPNGIAAGGSAFVSSFGTLTGGMRKFVDALPTLCPQGPANDLGQCIPLATPDTTSFLGSDFYRITLQEYSKQMHKDLPATGTSLRGYVQVDATGTPVAVFDGSLTPVQVASQQYLGPLILATKDRPVRVLFENKVTTDLQIPMDNTYMGAGNVISDTINTAVASQKRADLHLHGGNTPWISDGTPHQWVTPVGGDGQPAAPGFQKGVSFANVPDMVGTGNTNGTVPIPKPITSPALGDGLGTYFWTNQQSGRLMFFHDHAYGITRLNVYGGEAAGYLLVDPVQETALKNATVPGTIVTDPATGAIVSADLPHVLPLVIQDKTFVPDDGLTGGQLAATDPTWPSPTNCTSATCPGRFAGANTPVTYGFGKGDLWFPHVYMPNQNPYDVTGANAYGRWDYGPWFWPVFPTAIPPKSGALCASAAYNPPPAALTCPATPNPSGTPEGFMDTPVVNGTAYPSLTVDPTAYRFQILSAGNDRTWNLGLYVAVDAAGKLCNTANPTPLVGPSGVACTEVRMVPAVPAAARPLTPDCAIQLPMDAGGLAHALTNPDGSLQTATGLPAGCWPTYNAVQGLLNWPQDPMANPGGVVDPLTAGPPIIQIGSEGGLLPAPAVIPSTAISYDYNKRSVTVLNVLNHGLLLGPAERADVVIDFSAFAGQTLMLYNDAPAPVPASDPRSDYYTGNPDQSATGGSPSTQPGYGPNTRTVMQIKVNPTGAASTFSLPALTAALPGLFATTQDPIIVPESTYGTVNAPLPNTYVRISDTSMTGWLGGPVGSIQVTNGGSYSLPPTVNIVPAAGDTTGNGATATAALLPSLVLSVQLTNSTSGGFGYTTAPAVSFNNTNTGGTGAAATAQLGNGGVRLISVTAGGSGYLAAPNVVIGVPNAPTCPIGCVQATATATVRTSGSRNVLSVAVTNPGAGYVAVPTVQLVPTNGGTGATAAASLGSRVIGFTVTAGGSGYLSAPTVTVAAPPTSNCGPATLCKAATATATLAPAALAVTLTSGGNGYTAQPAVQFLRKAGDTGTVDAVATALPALTPLLPKTIQELFTADYGRMNATLGVELPATTATIQTTIPYGYIDPPTEIFKPGDTQIWKITHNGVDTHFIHFHLFTVQVINRVGWDGAIKPPDLNEMSFKDTVRMNPLEDIIVALRPMRQIDTLGITAPAGQPFELPNSVRLMDVTNPKGSTAGFLNVDVQNNPATVTNQPVNFGWEYVWHCHILGHEENDMMRAMALAVPPAQPGPALTAVKVGTGTGQAAALTFTDNSINETAWTVQSSLNGTGPWTTVGTFTSTTSQAKGGTVTFNVAQPRKTSYTYRVLASNIVGYNNTYAAPAVGYPWTSADSAPSNVSVAVVTN